MGTGHSIRRVQTAWPLIYTYLQYKNAWNYTYTPSHLKIMSVSTELDAGRLQSRSGHFGKVACVWNQTHSPLRSFYDDWNVLTSLDVYQCRAALEAHYTTTKFLILSSSLLQQHLSFISRVICVMCHICWQKSTAKHETIFCTLGLIPHTCVCWFKYEYS